MSRTERIDGDSPPSYKLTVEPPKLMRWLTADDLSKRLVLLDFDLDSATSNGDVRFDLEVAFRQKRVVSSSGRIFDHFYVACGGAEVEFITDNGRVTAATPSRTITVNYKSARKGKRVSRLVLSPSKAAGDLAPLGDVTLDSDTELTGEYSYQGTETTLEVIKTGPMVSFVVAIPRGEKAVRSFCLGNLDLFVVSRWDSPHRIAGRIGVRPTSQQLYGAHRQPLGKVKSLIGRFLLRHHIRDIQDPHGFDVRYSAYES